MSVEEIYIQCELGTDWHKEEWRVIAEQKVSQSFDLPP